MSEKFPEALKITRVVALFHGGDSNNIEYYRPISLLPILSTIYEKIFSNNYAIISNKTSY